MKTEAAKKSKERAGSHRLLRLDGQSYFFATRALRYRMRNDGDRSASKTRQEGTMVLRVPRENVSTPRSNSVLRLGMSRH